ncbi:di-heme-cytochrome C peroxidase [Rhizobium oryzicola]|uniref:Di-heme-cytochrome C peroxidase n=1 Tax=Rhizobium oryzicola TaxID=1232668 RepID=A0ABT8ST56_9HYPH|nr:di-heme-cytochrome C peroxidase [Rhizobium oryzicola]MDO1581506.1 di-heme-cytochrome C peroxidase [Rhizobium oryzicola]
MKAFKFIIGFACCLLSSGQGFADIIYSDQGPNWNNTSRVQFYTQDQGSRLIKLSWLQALKLPDGTPFLKDNLARYGYLPLDAPQQGIAVGFPITGTSGHQDVGMTCAACHTRQITVSGANYRIDGGPAIVDFHGFMTDLDKAATKIATDPAAFEAFARQVLASGYDNSVLLSVLKKEFSLWYERYHAIAQHGLPHESWGMSRLDAVGMIFNRLTGLDIGTTQNRLIVSNLKPADAPVRYPFLWNASIQDFTQWPGFAANGSDILALARNVGEVYGVFGEFAPKKDPSSLLKINYKHLNSVNFSGLGTLENLIKKIGPPHYPFATNPQLAAQGQAVFNRSSAAGGCVECHGITPGKTRAFFNNTWATPIMNVGTDTREYNILGWTAKTGVLNGAPIPFSLKRLGASEKSIDILTVSVLGSILQNYAPFIFGSGDDLVMKLASKALAEKGLSSDIKELQNAFPASRDPASANATAAKGTASTENYAYESRVLEGIWAAAPYLHNGSVPTLEDLLKPSDQRPAQFPVGAEYDPVKIGLSATQSGLSTTTVTTGCNDLNSGNSRCGHEFGTALPDADKKALLEYLKTL